MRRYDFSRCFAPCLWITTLFATSILYGQPSFTDISSSAESAEPLTTHSFLGLQSNAPIFEVEIDSADQIAYIQTRRLKKGQWDKRGWLTAYGLDSRAIKWQVPMNYSANHFVLADGIPVVASWNNSRAFDPHSGEIKWWLDRKMLAGLTGTGTALASRSENLHKIDLPTGKIIWTTHMRTRDTEGFVIYGDSVLISNADGLVYIDLNKGESWRVKGRTEASSSVGAMTGVVAGILVGGMVGGFVVGALTSRGSNTAGTGSTSHNFVFHEGHVYYGDYGKVGKYDRHGEMIWEFPIPLSVDLPKLLYRDSTLYVVRYGIHSTPEQVLYGDIHVSKIDESESTPHMEVRSFTENKRQFLNDFVIQDTTMVLAMSDRLMRISLSDFATVKENTFGDANSRMGMKYIANPPFFLQRDSSTWFSASEVCPGCVYIRNSSGMYIMFNTDLEIEAVVRPTDMYVLSQNLPGGLTAVRSDSETVWLDDDGHRKNAVHLGPRSIVRNGYTLDRQDREVWIYEGMPVSSVPIPSTGVDARDR